MVLIKPAVDGTLAVLKAAHLNKVKRVVITSSVAAIAGSPDPNKLSFSTSDWTDINIVTAYYKSKTMAE
jgi:dihydroflavonol-4-reductase